MDSIRFRQQSIVRASHCDQAGLLAASQYFLLINRLVEDWFQEALQLSFAQMHLVARQGVPTTQLDFRLHRPLQLGEQVELDLMVREIGRRRFDLSVRGLSGQETCFEADVALVFVTLAEDRPRSADIPDALRLSAQRFLERLEYDFCSTAT